MDRRTLLKKIVLFDKPEEAFCELGNFARLSKEDALLVDKNILCDVLTLYLNQQITDEDLKDWAAFVECNDEINCTLIEDFIFALANNEMIGGINSNSIALMLTLCK
ncbi:hypothetical protein [Pseudoalteromonas tunicata]|uniref:hypothetical protein n=1 Tax=Pseudoalteromonas tunicata TaxID=314281 RepID=UPI00273DA58E|nr:hypothetical protein [Pseudoalteromonas tunicata]MDP4985069.1 hypothetical protein [Pseudoalteromonas tunicata]